MAIQRISNVSLFNSTIRNIGSTQQSLYDLQQQISSGIKATDFRGLNGQVEQFVGLEAQLRKLELFQQNNSVIESRLKIANQSMDSIVDIVDQMENLMVQRRSATSDENLNFTLQMRDKLQAMADALNVTSDGRYLFSGTATNTKPVPEAIVTSVTLGVPDDGYYAGSKESVSNRVDSNIEVEFPVRADDPAFQKVFAAVNLALSSNGEGSIATAIDMIQQAQTDINSVQAKINSTLINISQIGDRQSQQKLYLQGITEEVAKTDIVAATTKVANDQAILQASYQVFARLVQLKLSDYL